MAWWKRGDQLGGCWPIRGWGKEQGGQCNPVARGSHALGQQSDSARRRPGALPLDGMRLGCWLAGVAAIKYHGLGALMYCLAVPEAKSPKSSAGGGSSFRGLRDGLVPCLSVGVSRADNRGCSLARASAFVFTWPSPCTPVCVQVSPKCKHVGLIRCGAHPTPARPCVN